MDVGFLYTFMMEELYTYKCVPYRSMSALKVGVQCCCNWCGVAATGAVLLQLVDLTPCTSIISSNTCWCRITF